MYSKKENKIIEILEAAGISPETKVCFEPLYSHFITKITRSKLEIISSKSDFYRVVRHYTKLILRNFADEGVNFVTMDNVVISPFAKIGAGTLIHGGTEIRSGVKIGENCEIGLGSVIENSTIGNSCVINASQIYSSTLEDNVKIGPFCHIRPNSYIKFGVKIGDFVEVKNSTLGKETHASHLTYIGDSDVGERVNFGCGTVTVNYDGTHKNRTVIGNDVFIGCNTNLIAPVKLGDNSYTAAGSTITEDVPEGALAIARERQTNKEGWTKR